jgi:hypothetical protein
MDKERQKPVLEIEGTPFIVDIDKLALVEQGNPEHEISFIDHMKDESTHYVLQYDREEQSYQKEVHNPGAIKEIHIPQLTALDPAGMAARYGYSESELRGRSDFEIMVDPLALNARLQGMLPGIEIAGSPFFVDLRAGELRPAEPLGLPIRLAELDLTEDGNHYQAFYHPLARQIVYPDPKLTEFPDHVVMIRLPNELGLDPVGTARKYGLEELEVVRRFPISKNLKAEVIPLADTGIPGLIQRNRQQLQNEHQQKHRKDHPKRRLKF